LKQYRAAIQIDEFWVADFETSLVLHHKKSGQVLLLSAAAFRLLSAFPSFTQADSGLTFDQAVLKLYLLDTAPLVSEFDQLRKAGYLVES
jgi:hypothetical protein